MSQGKGFSKEIKKHLVRLYLVFFSGKGAAFMSGHL